MEKMEDAIGAMNSILNMMMARVERPCLETLQKMVSVRSYFKLLLELSSVHVVLYENVRFNHFKPYQILYMLRELSYSMSVHSCPEFVVVST